MAYNTPYDYSEESVKTLDEKFGEVSGDRFLYCIQEQRRWDLEKVNHFIARLRTSHQYTSRELDGLRELEKTYNKEYPTNHKKYVSVVQTTVSKMHCTLSGLKKIVAEFRNKGKNKKDATLMDDTPLFTGPYSKDVFGWEAYEDNSAQDLLNELNSFLKDAEECIDLAVKMINEETEICNDPSLAYPLFVRDYQRSISDNRMLIKMIENQRPDLDNGFVKAYEEAEDARKLIASLFHAFNRANFNYNSACMAIHEGKKADLTLEESLIWGLENEKKVKQIRLLLSHIMELVEQREDTIGWKGMLSGAFVMHLLYWCGWDGTKNKAMLDYITKGCQGKIGVVKMGAVMAEKRKLAYLSNDVVAKKQNAFNQQMDDFVDGIMQKSSGNGN
ncbi:MAG: hypothetical protein IKQ03_10370 [Prevotella sp.]|nr:hypothetical protein [Prevotella sp.]